MRTPEPVDATVEGWRDQLSRGETVLIEQSRWKAMRYLMLTVVMAALCLWVTTFDDGWWLTKGAGYAGVLLFGVIGIPVLVRQVYRDKEPRVQITAARISVGSHSMPRSEISWVRIHNGSYGETTPDKSGGVSLFRGQEHALEVPLPPSVPTGAVERILLTDRSDHG